MNRAVRVAVALLCGCVAATIAACSTKLGDPNNPTLEGRPCASDRDCPQPQDPCQVWTCWQEVCTPVAAARDKLLPREAQKEGDCKVLVCDGQGRAVGIPDRTDEPPEDDNPCALEACEEGEPAFPPVAVGAKCGKNGVCNGKGKCGACLPQAQRCSGNKPETCTDEGAWESEGPCPAQEPICFEVACIGVAEVTAGAEFSCGRLANGRVRCFGNQGDRLGRSGARRVGGLSGVTQIAAGGWHTCALMDDQTVKCWGSNIEGALGDATQEARGVPAPVPKLEKVAQISAGESFTCARTDSASAVCWGSNKYGQLGTGTTQAKGKITDAAELGGGATPQDRPVEVASLSNAAALALGHDHACALTTDGSVACWGLDNLGVLGRGSPPASSKKVTTAPKAPPPVKGLKDVVEVAAGSEHACARLQDGTVACWGRNHHGQLGDGTTKDKAAPVKVKDLAGATALALGAAHSCALLSDGAVQCWGYNGSVQLGDATKADHNTPVAVHGLSGVTALSSGAQHLCAQLADATFSCWGSNTYGELGSGSSGDKPSPIVW